MAEQIIRTAAALSADNWVVRVAAPVVRGGSVGLRQRANPVSNAVCQQLDDLGFAGPVPILSAEQCRQFMAVLNDPKRVAPLDWPKGQAATSRAFYEIATLPKIMALVDAVRMDRRRQHEPQRGGCREVVLDHRASVPLP